MAVNTTTEEIPTAYDNIDQMLRPSLMVESQIEPKTCDRTDGMGSLINPCWLLTAGHVASELSTDDTIIFTQKTHSIEQVVIHPNFRNWGEELAFANNDIGLIKLAQPVETVKPLLLYKQKDELNQVATLLGSGDFGHGIIGPD